MTDFFNLEKTEHSGEVGKLVSKSSSLNCYCRFLECKYFKGEQITSNNYVDKGLCGFEDSNAVTMREGVVVQCSAVSIQVPEELIALQERGYI